MQIATSPTRDKYPLSTKKIIKKTLSGRFVLVFFFFFFLPAIIVPFIAGSANWRNLGFVSPVAIILFILIVVLTYLYQRWYFAVYYYELAEDFIVIRKGPITTHEITVPYERIQDVYVDQDILDRIFGLYDVHLSTATTSSAIEAKIDGVLKDGSEGLRNLLLETVQHKNSKKQ